MYSVEDLTKIAINRWGNGSYKVNNSSNSLHEAGLLQLNSNKAKDLLKWQPRWDAPEAVMKTIDWYKEVWINKHSATKSTVEQIKSYIYS